MQEILTRVREVGNKLFTRIARNKSKTTGTRLTEPLRSTHVNRVQQTTLAFEQWQNSTAFNFMLLDWHQRLRMAIIGADLVLTCLGI